MNLQFAPGIVDEMVKSVLGRDMALPLLQFALRALWEQRDRNRITRASAAARAMACSSAGSCRRWRREATSARSKRPT
ncbi:MAG: hypothetical protein KJ023_17765 [Burkholderiaceae bacterium]|nr:hypothetical protein [Burkholderiaceae bacterium]